MINIQIEKATQGREMWLELEDKYNVGNGVVLIYLCDDQELNEVALKNLKSLIEYRNSIGALIVTKNENNIELSLYDFGDYNIYLEVISKEQSENLLAFYELYQFTDYFYIVSMDKPWGNKLKFLNDRVGIEKEVILKECIYQIKS